MPCSREWAVAAAPARRKAHTDAVATRTFDLETTVPVAPADAIDFLIQLDRHRGLHPYIQGAERIAHGSDDEGPWVQWEIVDRPKLGPFPYTIRFPSRVTRTSVSSYISRVKAAPGCTLEIRTQASVTDAGTLVAETVTVSAPRPLLGYMTRQALLAHTRTFERLPGELSRQ